MNRIIVLSLLALAASTSLFATAQADDPPATTSTTSPSDQPAKDEPASAVDTNVPATPSTNTAAPIPAATSGKPDRTAARTAVLTSLMVFTLAVFLGFEVIAKVPPTLHTPLMSGSNAISGITIVGSIVVAGAGVGFSSFLGFVAVALAMINVVGGFLVTHRMLSMFKRK